MITVQVDYDKLLMYKGTQGIWFQVFMLMILYLWFSNVADELKSLLKLGDFLYNFPVDVRLSLFPPSFHEHVERLSRSVTMSMATRSNVDSSQSVEAEDAPISSFSKSFAVDTDTVVLENENEDGSHSYTILSISSFHWKICLFVFIARGALFSYMLYAGTIFLLNNHTMVDLLLNAVAMAFIFELDEFLYTFLVSTATQLELEQVNPMNFHSSFPQKGWGNVWISKGTWGLVFIPILALLVVVWNSWYISRPILKALQCVCAQDGAGCHDREIFPKEWWDQYWLTTSELAAGTRTS
jgi:hypothetical protein